jgi:hypothetical protein
MTGGISLKPKKNSNDSMSEKHPLSEIFREGNFFAQKKNVDAK